MSARLALVALLSILWPGTAAALQASPLEAALDSAAAALGLDGVSAAMIGADGTPWESAAGLASPGAPATPVTAFELGSISKMYTSAVVLRLVEDGMLKLEDPLARWFPELPGAERITVQQLLSHTHGLHDPLQDPDYVPSVLQNPAKVWTLDDVLERMRAPHFEPGAEWRYSNTGFHLLGAIVEAETDSAFADVLRARVLGPLGLDHTWYGVEDPEQAVVAAAYIDPSGAGSPQPVSLIMPWTAFRSSAGPAGGVVSTASDAARFLRALVTGGLLGESAWDHMTTWTDRPDGHRYGLGLLRIEQGGRALVGHKGNSAGYSGAAFHDLSSGVTAVVLTNAHAVDVTPVVTALLRAAAAAEAAPGG